MVDIQSATAEIKRDEKKEERRRKKKKLQGKNIMACHYRAAIIIASSHSL